VSGGPRRARTASAVSAPGPRVEALAPGLFAVLGARGDANSGFALAPGGAVVIDAQQNEALGRSLLEAVCAAGGGPIRALVNTHYHADHVFGNPAFAAEVEIVAHTRCRARLIEILERAGVKPGAPVPERLALELGFGSNLWDLVPDDDPLQASFRELYEASGYAGARVRLPTLTVDGECAFHLGDRRMVLRHLGPGHTEGDVVAWFPDDGVVFAADLVFHGRFPWLGDSDVTAWAARLEDLAALGAPVVVPGHGPPVGPAEVLAFRDLLRAVQAEVRALAREDLDEAAVVSRARLPAYGHLPRYAEWFPAAVRKLYRDLARGHGGGLIAGGA